MGEIKERRKEERVHYQFPVWFAEVSNEPVYQGVMVDISNSGLAFRCNADKNCPSPGQHLTTRFNIPRFGIHDPSDMKSLSRTGHVRRVDNIDNNQCCVAIQFDEPPPFWNIPHTKGSPQA